MPDTETQSAETISKETKTEAAVVSVGKPERVNLIPQTTGDTSNNLPVIDQSNVVSNGNVGADATQKATNGAVVEATAAPAPTLTEEQLKEYFKTQNIEYEGIDKLKEKINYVAHKELSEEDKKKQALVKEKRLVDAYVESGGTVKDFVAIKNIAEMDLSELSLSALKQELKDAKFTDEQIENYIKESYHQISDEDLEQYDEETDKEFAKRKKEFSANQLANRSSYTKKQAQDFLAKLNQEVESEDLQAQEEQTISSNIEEQFSKLPRKLTHEIGEINGKAIPPVEYEITGPYLTALEEAKDMLKDPAKRQQFLSNTDGSPNTTNLINVITRNIYLESAVKAAYHEGGSRQVTEFQKVFPSTAHELGVGGAPDKTAGTQKVAGYGKTQRIQPSTT